MKYFKHPQTIYWPLAGLGCLLVVIGDPAMGAIACGLAAVVYGICLYLEGP